MNPDGQPDHNVSLTFCTTIDQWFQAFFILRIHHIDESGINPSTRTDGVQASDDDVELHVEVLVVVLNLVVMTDAGQIGLVNLSHE